MEILLNEELMTESVTRNWSFFLFGLFFLIVFLCIFLFIISCFLRFNNFKSFSPFYITNICLRVRLFFNKILWLLIWRNQSLAIINQERAYINFFLIFIDSLFLEERFLFLTAFLILILSLLFFALSSSLLF